jgi:uncharacterized RDD family membrane protein YckC
MPAAPEQLDTRIEVVTAENIAFHYRLAGPFRRALAYLIDLVLRLALVGSVWFIVFLVSLTGLFAGIEIWGFSIAFAMILHFLLDWFYGGLFEGWLMRGQTPGKWLCKLRVVSIAGQPITPWQGILRNVLRSADALPVITIVPDLLVLPLYQVGLIATMFNRRYQRLGDLICGTMVVVEQSQQLYGVARVAEPAAVALAAELPPRMEITRSLARALSAYVQRRLSLSPGRRAEVSRHLGEPLRQQFGLPRGTSHDLLLCAMYHRAFIADRPEDHVGHSPFASPFRAAAVRAAASELEVPRTMSLGVTESTEEEATIAP